MNITYLHKYLSGECSVGEKQLVEDWLKADPTNREFMESLQRIWNVTPDDEFEVNAREAWSSFKKRVIEKSELASVDMGDSGMQQRNPEYYKYDAKKQHSRTKTFAYSIVAAAVILAALLFYQYTYEVDSDPEVTMQEIVTKKGQRATFRLSDGTRVQLNSDSKMEIPGEFMDASRDVYLDGEAFFEVMPNPDKPFIVHSGDAFTKVLGTKFGVRAYPEDKQVQIVVAEGKVSFGLQEQPTAEDHYLTKNQVGTLAQDGETNISSADDIEKYLGWKDGQLVFDDTSLKEIKPQLERWYNIGITITDPSLSARRLTASFNDEPMTEVLNVIALSMDMEYERDGREVTFKKIE